MIVLHLPSNTSFFFSYGHLLATDMDTCDPSVKCI